MKTKYKILIPVGCFLILVVLLFIILVLHNNNTPQTKYKSVVDLECLRYYADSYCRYEVMENKELEVSYVNKRMFDCYLINDERIRYIETTRMYYFLDEEIENCTYLIESEGGNN